MRTMIELFPYDESFNEQEFQKRKEYIASLNGDPKALRRYFRELVREAKKIKKPAAALRLFRFALSVLGAAMKAEEAQKWPDIGK